MIWVAFLIGLVLGILAGFEIQWRLIMGVGRYVDELKGKQMTTEKGPGA